MSLLLLLSRRLCILAFTYLALCQSTETTTTTTTTPTPTPNRDDPHGPFSGFIWVECNPRFPAKPAHLDSCSRSVRLWTWIEQGNLVGVGFLAPPYLLGLPLPQIVRAWTEYQLAPREVQRQESNIPVVLHCEEIE